MNFEFTTPFRFAWKDPRGMADANMDGDEDFIYPRYRSELSRGHEVE